MPRRYMSAQQAIHMYRPGQQNGNLLIMCRSRPMGTRAGDRGMLTSMGRCLDTIGEAVFFTRCWGYRSEGGIRFTRNKENTVYMPRTSDGLTTSCESRLSAASRIDLKTLASVSLFRPSGPIDFRQVLKVWDLSAAGRCRTNRPPTPSR